MTALKYAHEIRSALPNSYVSDLYIDMHAFGKGHEDFYRKSSEIKTLFLMYGKNERPVIRERARTTTAACSSRSARSCRARRSRSRLTS